MEVIWYLWVPITLVTDVISGGLLDVELCVLKECTLISGLI